MSEVKKVGERNAEGSLKVFFGAVGRIWKGRMGDVRLGAGRVGPVPIRLAGTELALAGQTIDNSLLETAGKVMAGEIQPIDDIRSTAGYRSVVLRNLLGEFLRRLPGARIAS